MGSILLFSGGLDSTVILAQEVSRGRSPFCLTFDYGQIARKELDVAVELMYAYRVQGAVVRIPPDLLYGSAITGEKELPKDLHFRDPNQSPTYVPARNLVFIGLAVAEAERRGVKRVLIGAHAPTGSVYKDATPAFCHAVSLAAQVGYDVVVEAPILNLNKKEIVALARGLKVPIESTWSCYAAGSQPCGRCGQCAHRADALTP